MTRLTRPSRSRHSTLAVRRLEDRTVPSSVQGTVFDDLNQNHVLDPGEPGQSGWTAYVDNNANSIIDVGEATTVTDANGAYFIDTSSIPTNGGGHYVGLDLQVGSGGRWVNDSPTMTFANPTTEPSAVRNFGVHFQPYLSVEPAGAETLVNVATTGSQSWPDVAADAAGNYVAAWYTGQSGNPIFARVFDADGTPQTGEIAVTTSSNGVLHVAMADNGRFVLAWSLYSASLQSNSVQARVYNANATPATGVITVAAASSQVTNLVGDVAMDSAGNFAVLYESYKKSGVRPEDHLVQRYTAAGTAIGKAVNVASSSIWQGARQSIAMDATGRFVVVWDQITTDGISFVFAQRFSSAGQKVGSQITVASSPNPALRWQSNVSINGTGRFAVTWAEHDSRLLKAQVYDWGTPVGGNITLGSSSNSLAAGSDVDAANNVTFSWACSDVNSRFATEVRFCRLTGGGVLEPESIVNTTTQGAQGDTAGYQSMPVGVAATGNDRFVVVCLGHGPGDDTGILMQRFEPAGSPRPGNPDMGHSTTFDESESAEPIVIQPHVGAPRQSANAPMIGSFELLPAKATSEVAAVDQTVEADFEEILPQWWGIRLDV